jgi:hypothetical protein
VVYAAGWRSILAEVFVGSRTFARHVLCPAARRCWPFLFDCAMVVERCVVEMVLERGDDRTEVVVNGLRDIALCGKGMTEEISVAYTRFQRDGNIDALTEALVQIEMRAESRERLMERKSGGAPTLEGNLASVCHLRPREGPPAPMSRAPNFALPEVLYTPFSPTQQATADVNFRGRGARNEDGSPQASRSVRDPQSAASAGIVSLPLPSLAPTEGRNVWTPPAGYAALEREAQAHATPNLHQESHLSSPLSLHAFGAPAHVVHAGTNPNHYSSFHPEAQASSMSPDIQRDMHRAMPWQSRVNYVTQPYAEPGPVPNPSMPRSSNFHERQGSNIASMPPPPISLCMEVCRSPPNVVEADGGENSQKVMVGNERSVRGHMPPGSISHSPSHAGTPSAAQRRRTRDILAEQVDLTINTVGQSVGDLGQSVVDFFGNFAAPLRLASSAPSPAGHGPHSQAETPAVGGPVAGCNDRSPHRPSPIPDSPHQDAAHHAPHSHGSRHQSPQQASVHADMRRPGGTRMSPPVSHAGLSPPLSYGGLSPPHSTGYPQAPLSRGRMLAPKLDLTLRPDDIRPEGKRRQSWTRRQRVEVTQSLRERIDWLRQSLFTEAQTSSEQVATDFEDMVVRVRRGAHIVDDTLEVMGDWPVARWRQGVIVHFEGEQGIDCGALTREWAKLLCQQLLRPGRGLFRRTAKGNRVVVLFDQESELAHGGSTEGMYHFVGRFLAFALWRGIRIDAVLSPYMLRLVSTPVPTLPTPSVPVLTLPTPSDSVPTLCAPPPSASVPAAAPRSLLAPLPPRHALRSRSHLPVPARAPPLPLAMMQSCAPGPGGAHAHATLVAPAALLTVGCACRVADEQVAHATLEDLREVDPKLHANLSMMLTCEPSLIEDTFCQSFCIDTEFLGARNTYDLKAGGSEVSVTGANVQEFVDLYVQHVLYVFCAKALCSFLAGFHSLIPPGKVKDFSTNELEALICGQPEITDQDVEQLRAASHCSLDAAGRPHAQVLWALKSEARNPKPETRNPKPGRARGAEVRA